MHSRKVNTLLTQTIPFLLLLLLLNNGCARKPWLEPVEESLDRSIRTTLLIVAEQRASCSMGLNAEATISWSSTFKKKSLTGFLQLLPPSHAKVVAVNPLGQPVLALASNGNSFQTVNTLKREYSQGDLKSFALRYDLPKPLLSGNWVYWLTGHLPSKDEEISVIREDLQGRGFWISNDIENNYTVAREYLLLTSDSYLLLTRIITDSEDNIIARIEYSDWLAYGLCNQPTNIHITKISSGVEATIELKDIIWDDSFTEKDFDIKVPPGYLQRRFH